MANARLYRFWGSLTEALQTGQPQNEVKTGENFFATLYADPQRLEGFLTAMTRPQRAAASHCEEISLEEVQDPLWTSEARRAVWRSRWRSSSRI